MSKRLLCLLLLTASTTIIFMLKNTFITLCLCIAISCGHKERHSLVLSQYQYEFGKVKQGDLCSGQVKIYNREVYNINISKVTGDCGCTAVYIDNRTIASGDSTNLHFTLDKKKKKGRIENFVIIEANTDSVVHYIKLTADVE